MIVQGQNRVGAGDGQGRARVFDFQLRILAAAVAQFSNLALGTSLWKVIGTVDVIQKESCFKFANSLI